VSHAHHLYLHIPFCQRRCSYCDFNTYANLEDRIEAYVQALCTEMGMLSALPAPSLPRAAAHPLRPTVYFGGGTPSMLSLAQVERVLAAAGALVPLDEAEITLEANPGSVLGAGSSGGSAALDYFRGLRSLGVSRLSLGVQTLHDPTLRVLGRTHTAADARQCFAAARQAGFENISLDFMFGLPGQSLAEWQSALDAIATWGADHFSLYSLILEESTPLYAQVVGGRVSVPDDDITGAMYEQAMERLAAAGYAQYEISNWARRDSYDPEEIPSPLPRLASQHNLAYWLNVDYLAAGAGAHGHAYPERYANILGVDEYIATVGADRRPVLTTTPLTRDDLYAETMFMGLRLNSGVSAAHFQARCGVEMQHVYGPTLEMLRGQGLLDYDVAGARLSARGRMLGNQVFSHFVG
jgi:oxygen-independent coproporphyrinogen-3 oxidase